MRVIAKLAELQEENARLRAEVEQRLHDPTQKEFAQLRATLDGQAGTIRALERTRDYLVGLFERAEDGADVAHEVELVKITGRAPGTEPGR